MGIESFDLAWIVVKDLKKAVNFYTKTVGLQLSNMSEEYGWAELHGKEGGARLGIAQDKGKKEDIQAGSNAVVTFRVQDLEIARKETLEKGAVAIGNVLEIQGHVRMQLFVDIDGNHFQLVQMLGIPTNH